MSRFLAQIEGLAAVPFILRIAAIGGTLQAIPALLHFNLASARVARVALVNGMGLFYSIGAALLWWFAVRRRQYPISLTALHVTLGLMFADLLMNGLGLVVASIDTHGEFASEYAGALPGALWGPAGSALLRSPFWFVQALVLIAVGRLVLRMDTLVAPGSAAPTHPDAVT